MPRNTTDRLGDLEVRQTRLESAVENVVLEVHKLSDWMQRLDVHIQRIGRPNWQNWIAAAALTFTSVVAISGMYIRPLQLTTEYNYRSIQDLDESVEEVHKLADTVENRLIQLDAELSTRQPKP